MRKLLRFIVGAAAFYAAIFAIIQCTDTGPHHGPTCMDDLNRIGRLGERYAGELDNLNRDCVDPSFGPYGAPN